MAKVLQWSLSLCPCCYIVLWMSLDEDRLEPRLRDPDSGAPTISEFLLHIKGYISVSHMSLRPFHKALQKVLNALSQYQHLLYDYLRERARWTKFCAVIGYPSKQDGLSCQLWITCWVPQEHSILFPYNKINPLLTKLVLSRWLDIGQKPYITSLVVMFFNF